MISRPSTKRRAVTLTELLVVLAIISLLATIAVPVYLQKSEQARVAVARQEVRSIAEAEQQVFALYGFFVPIHILDNIPDPLPGASLSGTRDDFESDPNLSSKYVMDPLGSLPDQSSGGNQANLGQLSQDSNARVRRLVSAWTGPFLNAQRIQMGDKDQGAVGNVVGAASQTQVSNALIVDPWGYPYRMYSPLGVVGSAGVDLTSPPTLNQTSQLYDLNYDDGRLTNNDRRFDRWAIISFGRDGISDSAAGKYAGGTTNLSGLDDIFYTFGITVGESFYRAF